MRRTGFADALPVTGSVRRGFFQRLEVLRGVLAALLAGALVSGCGHKEGEAHAADDGHGHGEESPSGASFKAGKGVLVTAETRAIIGLETADVDERKLANEIRLTVQVFGEKHHHAAGGLDHSGCDIHGSGFVPTNLAATLAVGQAVEFPQGTNATVGGVVLGVQKSLTLGESEVVVGITNATAQLMAGGFVPAIILLPEEEVVAVPQSALLRTSEGTFVYAVNGDAFFRTAVKIGSSSGGWLEILDGLLAGDAVVTKPAETLWLIELRATKGGGHSH